MSLWIDVTGLLHGVGHFSGVPRVRTTLILNWLDDSELELRFFDFDTDERTFREVPPAYVRDLLGRIGVGSRQKVGPPPVTTLSRWNESSRRLVEKALFLFPSEVRRAAFDCYAAGINLLKALLRPLRARRPRGPSFAPARFSAGDGVVLLDWFWIDCGYAVALVDLARTQGVRISPLVYDLLPWRMPQFFSVGFGDKFCDGLAKLLRETTLAVTVSQHARGEIAAFCQAHGIELPAVEVMVLGGDLEDVSPSGGKLPVPEPFVMAVGAVGVRKNYGLLYQVWRELIQKHGARTPNLALVGGVGFLTGDLLYQLQRDPVVQGKIHQVGGIDDGLLRELYSRCLFTVYPSIYEGSGTPVVESLAAGKACVASSSSSVPEMGGELAEYHHPQDFKRCLELVERLWLDEAYRRKREEEIRRKFRATSWREASRIYVGFLRAHLERAREDARAGEPAMRLSALGGKP